VDRRVIADTSGIIAFYASLIVLAERHQIKRILTLDRRHFNLLQSDRIDYLEVLP
jgi:hypothetical protein